LTGPPATKPELLALINERWAALWQLVGALNDEEMERPLGDGWSPKVHAGHVTAWERSLVALLRGQHRGEAMGLSRETWDAHDSGDESSWPATGDAVNAALAAAAQVQPLAEVLAQSASTHAELLALLGSMTQEDLDRPYSHYQPDNPPLNPAPVAGWIHGNTWEHYNEHIGWLEAGLRG
jgi:hypothetical protein